MRSIVTLLVPAVVCKRVVDALGPEKIFENDLKTAPLDIAVGSVMAMIPQFGAKSEKIEREKAIRLLMKSIALDHAKEILCRHSASYKSRSAERAQEVLRVATTAAMQQHLDANRNPEQFRLFFEQESILKERVREANQATPR
ncbi:MAG: hypothetical protein H6821_12165 [Planctomycetaceae bacterium]|nr:hypothetical protein [Planctomycetaceae bacterium]